MKRFTIVLSCEKYKSRRDRQDKAHLGDYKYFIGDSSLVTKPICDSRPKEDGDIVYLPCPDTYEALASKVVGAIEWALENREFTHILKTDDDVRINEKILDCDREAEAHDYSGIVCEGGGGSGYHRGQCMTNYYVNMRHEWIGNDLAWCKGGAYYLSRKACEAIVNTKSMRYWKILEDVTIAGILRSHKITPVPLGEGWTVAGKGTLILKACRW